MLGSTILETAVGLILIFLLMSLICSALREAFESMMKQRALDLQCGIRELLQDPDGNGLAKELYSHPLVYGLFTGEYKPIHTTSVTRWFLRGGKLPSYIPSNNFARALLDLEQHGRIESPEMNAVLRSLAQGVGDDMTALRTNVEEWFNGSTERIGGWYKRRTQGVLFAIGVAAAIALNVNPLVIGSALFKEADLRATAVATAESIRANGAAAVRPSYEANMKQLHDLAGAGLPMGWETGSAKDAPFYKMILGWLITALAVTLGAPFWFDLLNKFMSVRSTVKPKTNARTEETTVARNVVAVSRTPGAGAVLNESLFRKREAIPLPLVAANFERHEWADGVEDGVL
jgi:hypothetical protein